MKNIFVAALSLIINGKTNAKEEKES